MKVIDKIKRSTKAKLIIILIIVLIIITSIGIAYAKYVTTIKGSSQMQIAKWNFNCKILDSTQTQKIENFAITRKDDNDDVNSNTIAPRN